MKNQSDSQKLNEVGLDWMGFDWILFIFAVRFVLPIFFTGSHLLHPFFLKQNNFSILFCGKFQHLVCCFAFLS